MTTNAKNETIQDVIVGLQDMLDKVNAITSTASVQYFDATSLFVGAQSATGLLFAEWITAEELQVCADHGMGLPFYVNGKGDKSRLIPMEQAKEFEIATINKALTLLSDLVDGDGQPVEEGHRITLTPGWGFGGQTV